MLSLNRFAYLFGVCLAVATLLGAAQLTGSKLEQPSGAGGNPKPAAAGAAVKSDGLVQKGTVAAEHDPLALFLPSHLSAGRVAEVRVKDGQTVKPGDVLVRFDDWQLKLDLAKAEATVTGYGWEAQSATIAKQEHAEAMTQAENDLANAKKQATKAKEVVDAIREKMQKTAEINRTTNLRLTQEYPEVLKAEGVQDAADNLVKKAQAQIDRLKLQNPDILIQASLQRVKAAEAERDKAKQAIERCIIVADFAGTIERVTAHVGQVVYPQMRQPLCYVIPDGARVVKVEVVPEFAHKIFGKEGTKVSITDDTNGMSLYDGTLERICSAFLPKTNGLDLVTGKPSNVLEVIVRVVDAAPMGKPPLRVGQPVRVTFP